MSESENHHHGKNEVIIVKKHGGDHDGHHGGAWKIAYADFMTAMMAFFLVMWLVNAANEETKASVASYFNPIKFSDEKPTQKGLKKPVDEADGEQKQQKSKNKEENPNNGAAAASGDDATSTSGDETRYSEADFFENPYSVLAEIAQEVGQQANVSAKGEGGASTSGPATGAEGGEAYRDPFDPDFWTKQVEVTQASKGTTAPDSTKPDKEATDGAVAMMTGDKPGEAKSKKTAATASETPGEMSEGDEAQPPSGKSQAVKTQDSAAVENPLQEHKADQNKAEQNKTADHDTKVESLSKAEQQAKAADDAKAEKQAQDLRDELAAQMKGVTGKLAEGVSVTPTEGGLLVSISDQGNDSMFDVGSAVPRPEMVLAMQKIGEVLKNKAGSIFIRGHTDGRQYKGTNENWRLSMNRAQAAYYMLVRAGFSETRVMQVSGYADRMLKDQQDPLDPSNRRIEILVQGGQG